MDIHTLIFRNKAEQLQYDIPNQSANQIFFLISVKKRHIQNFDIHFFVLGYVFPFLQNLIVVSAKTIDTFYDKQIPLFQFLIDKLMIRRPIEIFTTQFIHINILFVNSHVQ